MTQIERVIKQLVTPFGRYVFLGVLCSFCTLEAVSQTKSSNTKTEEDIDWDKQLIKEVKLENPVYKPIVSVGFGALTFWGDVHNPGRLDPTIGNKAVNVDILRTLNPQFKFGFRFLYGTLNGTTYDELNPKKQFNFQSRLMAFGTNVSYNFSNFDFIGKNENRVLTPFVSLGLEMINFDTWGDLKAANGSEYYYWADGTTRNKSDLPSNGQGSVVLYRDHNYETSLKDKNIDGIKSQLPVSVGIPIDFGFDFTISQKATFRIGSSMHITFSDRIDDIGTDGNNYKKYPERKGNGLPDFFSYSYAQFSLDLFSKTTEEQQLQFIDLGAGGIFDFWDTDGDFVIDVYDACPWTPPGQPVDTVGCPFDDDGDGIPNFADKEADSPKDAFYIDSVGRSMTKTQILALLNDKKSFDQAEIYRHYPSLLEGTGLYHRFYKAIPEKYKSLDENKDDYISLDELLKTIDTFFDGDSKLSVDDLYELEEFFFIQ